MPEIDQLADGGALRIDDDIPIERSAGTRKVHGLPADPPNASDTGTDAFQVNLGRDVNDEELVIAVFDSANTTTTPTLENTGGTPAGAKTIQLPDGSAVRVGAIQNSTHIFQYDSGTDTWFLLNPAGSFLVEPATSSDPSLAFDTWRTPNADRPTLVAVDGRAGTDGTTNGLIRLEADESGGTTVDYDLLIAYADSDAGANVNGNGSASTIIPAGGSYQIKNVSDPNGSNLIRDIREFTL